MSNEARFMALASAFERELRNDLPTRSPRPLSLESGSEWWSPIAEWGRNRPKVVIFLDRFLGNGQEHSWFGFYGTKTQVGRLIEAIPEDLGYAKIGDRDLYETDSEYYLSPKARAAVQNANGLAFEHYDNDYYFGQYDFGFKAASDRELIARAADFVRDLINYITPHFLQEQDVDEIEKRTDINKTTKKQLIDARRGQGKFRRELCQIWGGCSVTGCDVNEVLRASHIKPWRSCSNDEERLDAENGLLLVATLDALFDRGLITFNDDGEMIPSSRLSAGQRTLVLHPGKRGLRNKPSNAQKKYLAGHQQGVFHK
jgi:hypothetical protein